VPRVARRLGCWMALCGVSLVPGIALLASGAWIRAHGGGSAVMLAAVPALLLGAFLLVAIGAALRRSTRDAGPPESPPG